MAALLLIVDEAAGATEAMNFASGPVLVVSEAAGAAESFAFRADSQSEPTTMPSVRTKKLRVPEGTSPLFIDRVWDDYADDPVLPGEVHSITARVYDRDGASPGSVLFETALPFGTVVALAQHASGLPDAVGYNFLWRADAYLFPEGGHTYEVEFDFTILANDGYQAFRRIVQKWLVETSPRRSA